MCPQRTQHGLDFAEPLDFLPAQKKEREVSASGESHIKGPRVQHCHSRTATWTVLNGCMLSLQVKRENDGTHTLTGGGCHLSSLSAGTVLIKIDNDSLAY